MKRIALVACGKTKLDHRAAAESLYIGNLFVKSLAFARRLRPDEIYILSAKHGLLELKREIDPYEQTLVGESNANVRLWAEGVLTQLRAITNLKEDHFTILAGLPYRRHLTSHLTHVEVPMKGLSQGKQLEFLCQQLQ
jgi:hypothetical protein